MSRLLVSAEHCRWGVPALALRVDQSTSSMHSGKFEVSDRAPSVTGIDCTFEFDFGPAPMIFRIFVGQRNAPFGR
jgi:hypothetical protein